MMIIYLNTRMLIHYLSKFLQLIYPDNRFTVGTLFITLSIQIDLSNSHTRPMLLRFLIEGKPSLGIPPIYNLSMVMRAIKIPYLSIDIFSIIEHYRYSHWIGMCPIFSQSSIQINPKKHCSSFFR
jgi:hypothetical protein